ncbi:hypothetical protein ES703_117424 [subsurface metagenome]
MKKIRYKSILLVLCLSMFSGALSLGFVRAVVPPANSCYLTETIVVFDQEPATTGNHAIKTITIQDLPVESVYMKMQAHLSSSEVWLRAIGFRIDGRGEGIDVRRTAKFQVRGYGTISPGQTKPFPADPDYYDMSNCRFAVEWDESNPTGSQWINFITEGYFSPGVHTIDAYVTSPHAGTWISITLVITYKFIPATIDFDPDNLNPKSQGNWVTVYIEFPECDDCSVSDIDINTILLNGVFPAEDHPTGIGDHDGDGKLDLMVKFDRQALIGSLMPGQNVDMIISGELSDGTPFEGKDIIDVLF